MPKYDTQRVRRMLCGLACWLISVSAVAAGIVAGSAGAKALGLTETNNYNVIFGCAKKGK